MVYIRPFRGLRPDPKYVSKVASPPYDVLSSQEARDMAKENPHSFLHVVKPEIDLPSETNPYDDVVYRAASENLDRLSHDGIMIQDETESFYLYQLQMGIHIQTGLVAVASVDDYLENRIKKHEFTRPEKEDDRTRHILTSRAQAGPVFCIHRTNSKLRVLYGQVIGGAPEVNFTADDGIRHTLWKVSDKSIIDSIQAVFAGLPEIYIADGHHRSAAGSRAAQQLRKENSGHTGKEEYNYFLTVIFPDDEMQILPYNRVIKDLRQLEKDEFMNKLAQLYQIETVQSDNEAEPHASYNYAMYTRGKWHRLIANTGSIDTTDPVESLDVQVLSRTVLDPILGITDPRTDPRIDFVGGIRGLTELKKLVDSGKWDLAFGLKATTVDQLLRVADAGKVMPPKSTWFEPKLRSGMVVHLLD